MARIEQLKICVSLYRVVSLHSKVVFIQYIFSTWFDVQSANGPRSIETVGT